MRQNIRKLSILSLCGIILLTQWACVRTAGPPLGENFNQTPVRIGVTTGRFIPITEFKNFKPIREADDLKQGDKIRKKDPWWLPEPPLPILLALALFVVVGYGTYKIFEEAKELFTKSDDSKEIAKSPENKSNLVLAYQENETPEISTPREMLEKALDELRMHKTFGEVFVTKGRASTPHTFIMVKEYGPQTKDDLPSNYHELLEKRLDMILELRIESIGFINGGGGDDPSFSLSMKVRVRLIGLPGQNKLYNNHFFHRSEQRTFREWADKQGKPFEAAIINAYEDLANQIIH